MTCVSPAPAHRLDEFSGDMLGHLLRAFGDMNYYDDELLEVGGLNGASQLTRM